VTDKDGNFICIDGVVQDITERKQVEEELRIKESAIASSISAIGITDFEGTLIYVNYSLVEMWGYESTDEILGRNLVELLEGEGGLKTIEALREKGGKIGEDIGKRKDGSLFDVEFSASMIKDETSKSLYIFGSFIDISERKEADQNYRAVADFTYDWEYWANLDGTLKYVSPSCERVSGYSVQDFIENPSLLREIVVPEDLMIWDKHFHDSRQELQAEEIIFRIHRRDGEIRWIEHVCQSIIDDRGSLLGFRASNRDITIRKQAEEALKASQEEARLLAGKLITTQEQERTRLACELHDDITQRLALMNIEVDKLELQHKSLSEPIKEKLRQIGDNLGELASDIAMISRQLHPSILHDLGLIQAIESECNNFTRLREIPVTLDLDTTLQNLSKETGLCIYRILQEGLRNIDQHARATDIQVQLSKNNNTVYFVLRDNGVGFDLDSSSRRRGLGLASMGERARLINGDLSIEPRPGKGTVIKLEAPFVARDKD
jgi:PAS domain S-box-containing protein